jgi:chromosome segregation ATPase
MTPEYHEALVKLGEVTLEHATNTLEHALAAWKQEVKRIKAERDELAKELTRWRWKALAESAQNTQAVLRSDLKATREEAHDLRTRLETAVADKERTARELYRLRHQPQKLTRAMRQKIERVKTERDQARDEVKRLQDAFTPLNHTAHRLAAELQAEQAKRESAEAEEAAAREEAHDLRTRLETAVADKERTARELFLRVAVVLAAAAREGAEAEEAAEGVGEPIEMDWPKLWRKADTGMVGGG